MVKEVDILIVGGGLTGAALMLALAGQGYHTLLIDKNSLNDKMTAGFNARTLALSPASINILQGINIWPILEPKATPIKMIQVSQQGGFGLAHLRGTSERPLGYVVEMHEMNLAFSQGLDQQQFLANAQLHAFDKTTGVAHVMTPTGKIAIQAKLLVAADGTESALRRFSDLPVNVTDYQQSAVVANIGLVKSHQHCAYERFTTSGPLALLPMTGQCMSLVWSVQPAYAKQLLAYSENEFLTALQKAVGYRLGRFSKVGERVIFPLRQVIMPQQTAWPLVFIGNAAHTLHPVAGQGFNLGLRDVAILAQCISQRGLNPAMLDYYQSLRRFDQQAIIGFTNGLINIFTSRFPGVSLAADLGLLFMDNSSHSRKILLRYAAGFAGATANLACGIPLPGNLH